MISLTDNFTVCSVLQPIQDLASSPPESSFQKLAPSEHRYTLLREKDEL